MNSGFVKTIIALRGEKGRKWLEDLPKIIKWYEEKWKIKVFDPFILSYNYVAPAKTLTGENTVLKISFPENDEFEKEIKALEFFGGQAAVNVLKKDLGSGVVLLEKAEPGKRLRDEVGNTKQISIASEVIKKLHQPITKDLAGFFPTIANWAKAFDRFKKKFSLQSGPIPKWMFDKGEGIFKDLGVNGATYLLHGDLHSDNILSSERGWLIIDPKGVVGEREFELGAFLRNPIYNYPKGSDYKKITRENIIQFSQELGFDKKRILDWSFACAVISILWFLEDQGKLKRIYMQNAEMINEISI